MAMGIDTAMEMDMRAETKMKMWMEVAEETAWEMEREMASEMLTNTLATGPTWMLKGGLIVMANDEDS